MGGHRTLWPWSKVKETTIAIDEPYHRAVEERLERGESRNRLFRIWMAIGAVESGFFSIGEVQDVIEQEDELEQALAVLEEAGDGT